MSIIDKYSDTYLKYKYRVHEIYLLFPDGEYKLGNERVNSITIMDHYLENLYPVIKIDLALEQSLYNRIIKNKQDLKVRLNVRKYYRENTNEEKSMMSNYINGLFTLILDDGVNTIDSNAHDLEFPQGDLDQMNAVQINMELFLFKGDLIKTNANMMNAILKKCTVSNAIGYLLSKAGASKVLMSRPNNQKVYDELIIPPLKIAKAFAFVDSYYGIYDTGTIIYFGLDRGYIIPFCKPANALENGEPDTVCIIVPNIGSSITDNICTLKKGSDPSKPYLIADPSSFEPAERSVTANVLQAEDITVVDNDSGDIDSSNQKNKNAEIQPTENPFYKKIYEATVKSNECVISIAFKDSDLSVLTPNKKYQFIFEDTSLTKKYKGTYYLVQCDSTYVKESGDLTGGAIAVFRKSVV